MNTLSVIKLTAMARAFQQTEAGLLDLDARLTLEPDEYRGGSGLLQTFDPGLRPTVRDVVTQMIITSDNTATDMVLAEVGREDVNHMLDSLGYEVTRFKMSTGELFDIYDQRLAAAREAQGDDFDPARFSFDFEGDSTVWLGRSTPRETARLLTQIYEGDLATEAHSEEMVDILRQQFYTSRLPRTIRGGVRIAHKTGDWPPDAGNDVGLIFYDGGPIVVAVYVNQNRGDFLDVERTIGHIAEDLVAAWSDGGD
jgi:beta-lactamase class A